MQNAQIAADELILFGFYPRFIRANPRENSCFYFAEPLSLQRDSWHISSRRGIRPNDETIFKSQSA
ncbi:MAG: hypothetical protein WCE73_20255 [Candidatus Angelobacter sp.]